MISDIKRKSLPAIAKAVGLHDAQSLHHFLSESPWDVQQFRRERLKLILQIDETGDCKKGKTFERTFSNGETETRYIREIIYGYRREVRYWQLTSDPQTLPDNSTWYVMSHAPMFKFNEIGDQYGFRIWVEYGLKQSKDELGWADFRMTRYEQIEKWWEMVMSAFLMVSLFAEPFNDCCPLSQGFFAQHPWWDNQKG